MYAANIDDDPYRSQKLIGLCECCSCGLLEVTITGPPFESLGIRIFRMEVGVVILSSGLSCLFLTEFDISVHLRRFGAD